jgi:hypothetical protein
MPLGARESSLKRRRVIHFLVTNGEKQITGQHIRKERWRALSDSDNLGTLICARKPALLVGQRVRHDAYAAPFKLAKKHRDLVVLIDRIGDVGLDCTPVVRQRNQGQVAIDAVGGRLRAAANGDKFASNSMGGR